VNSHRRADANARDDDGGRVRGRVAFIRRCNNGAGRLAGYIVPLLKAKGFRVTTPGSPLTSFADDVASTKRAIAAQDGPTVLVGHFDVHQLSWNRRGLLCR
jgi:hypothetical protein